jgi:raffinose/stachyose/melibiose transport system permease protein
MSSTSWVTGRKPWTANIRYVVLGLIAVPWIVLPLWMIIVNSWKSEGDASVPSVHLPRHWAALSNYRAVIVRGQYFTGLRNSLLVAVPTVLAVILLGTMAAWTYARAKSKASRFGFYATTLSIILPPAIVPTVLLINHSGLAGTMYGYILALTGTRLGVMIFLTTGYLRALPPDFEEAAQVDGASPWQTYWHCVLPLLGPVIFASAIMTLINVWNDFFFALYLLGTNESTLPLTLYTFANSSEYGVRWNLVFAHVLLTSLPLLITYIFLQRRIVSGLTEGGVTG